MGDIGRQRRQVQFQPLLKPQSAQQSLPDALERPAPVALDPVTAEATTAAVPVRPGAA